MSESQPPPSQPIPLSAAARKQYLGQVFEKNPVWQAGEILKLRRQTFGPASADSAATGTTGEDLFREQQALREKLKTLRANFFEMADGNVRSAIDELAVDKSPELSTAVSRLRVAATHRNTLISLFHRNDLESNLIYCLGWVLVQPSADARQTRETYLQSLYDFAKRQKAIATVNYLAKHHADLFALEQDWLTTIRTSKISGAIAGPPDQLQRGGWFPVWVILIAILSIARILAAIARA